MNARKRIGIVSKNKNMIRKYIIIFHPIVHTASSFINPITCKIQEITMIAHVSPNRAPPFQSPEPKITANENPKFINERKNCKIKTLNGIFQFIIFH